MEYNLNGAYYNKTLFLFGQAAEGECYQKYIEIEYMRELLGVVLVRIQSWPQTLTKNKKK